ncbi:MAG: hypothetical protein IID51_02515 [Proteobacteria bacterium]|nr:hypothetical protein [Pseudomonadota bacterium]
MFDMSGIPAAFARPGISATEGVQRASAIWRASEAMKARGLPVTAAPSQAVKTDAAYWVDYAESRIASIGGFMEIYNHAKNRPESDFQRIEQEYGPEIAAQAREGRLITMKAAETVMVADDMSIRANFDVTGTIFEKNAAGDYQFGKFTIDRAGDGFAIHIDSEDGTKLAFNRGRFTDRFSRANMLGFDRLPFDRNGALRTDLIA